MKNLGSRRRGRAIEHSAILSTLLLALLTGACGSERDSGSASGDSADAGSSKKTDKDDEAEDESSSSRDAATASTDDSEGSSEQDAEGSSNGEADGADDTDGADTTSSEDTETDGTESTSGDSAETTEETGTGVTTSGGGVNTATRERLPETLRQACMDMCDGQFALGCAPVGTSIEICDLQCVASVSTQREFCIDEYIDRTRCLADGGFECVNDYPVARSTCAGETLAYSECVQDLPCKMYCAALMETGCAEDEEACREECIAGNADDDLSCEIRQNSYVNCVGLLGLTCQDGQVIPHESCLSQLFDAADCRNDGDLCSTWCEGEAAMGCATDDCLDTCQAAMEDPTCATDYERMLDCGIRYGYVGCTEDGLETQSDSVLCDSEVERYAECMTNAEAL